MSNRIASIAAILSDETASDEEYIQIPTESHLKDSTKGEIVSRLDDTNEGAGSTSSDLTLSDNEEIVLPGCSSGDLSRQVPIQSSAAPIPGTQNCPVPEYNGVQSNHAIGSSQEMCSVLSMHTATHVTQNIQQAANQGKSSESLNPKSNLEETKANTAITQTQRIPCEGDVSSSAASNISSAVPCEIAKLELGSAAENIVRLLPEKSKDKPLSPTMQITPLLSGKKLTNSGASYAARHAQKQFSQNILSRQTTPFSGGGGEHDNMLFQVTKGKGVITQISSTEPSKLVDLASNDRYLSTFPLKIPDSATSTSTSSTHSGMDSSTLRNRRSSRPAERPIFSGSLSDSNDRVGSAYLSAPNVILSSYRSNPSSNVTYAGSNPTTPGQESKLDQQLRSEQKNGTSSVASATSHINSSYSNHHPHPQHSLLQEHQNQRLIAENRRLTAEITEMTAELADLRSTCEAQKNLRLNLAREAQWSVQIQEQQNENTHLKSQVDELTTHVNRMRAQMEGTLRELRAARDQLGIQQSHTESLENRLQDRENALATETASSTRLRNDLRERTSELARLRVEKDAQHREYERRIQELTDIVEEANHQRASYVESSHKHEKERSELLAAKQALSDQLRSVQSELSRVHSSQEAEVEQWKTTLRKAQTERAEMELSLQSTSQALERVSDVEKKYREEVRTLKEALTSMEARHAELQIEAERANDYYTQLMELNDENERLGHECDRAVIVRQEMHKECERLRGELRELHRIVMASATSSGNPLVYPKSAISPARTNAINPWSAHGNGA